MEESSKQPAHEILLWDLESKLDEQYIHLHSPCHREWILMAYNTTQLLVSIKINATAEEQKDFLERVKALYVRLKILKKKIGYKDNQGKLLTDIGSLLGGLIVELIDQSSEQECTWVEEHVYDGFNWSSETIIIGAPTKLDWNFPDGTVEARIQNIADQMFKTPEGWSRDSNYVIGEIIKALGRRCIAPTAPYVHDIYLKDKDPIEITREFWQYVRVGVDYIQSAPDIEDAFLFMDAIYSAMDHISQEDKVAAREHLHSIIVGVGGIITSS